MMRIFPVDGGASRGISRARCSSRQSRWHAGRIGIWRFGKDGFGSIRFATKAISRGTSITFISIRLGMPWCGASATGRIPRFTAMCARAFCRMTGRGTPVATKVISANGCSDRMQRAARMSEATCGTVITRIMIEGPGCRFAHPGYAKKGAPVEARRRCASSDQPINWSAGRSSDISACRRRSWPATP
jgi:hypothetical protein